MQSIDNVLKLRKGLKPDDPNPDIFDVLWAKKLSGAAKEYTITGNPLSFLAKKAQMAKSTKISITPIQDLHGYDNPWPAGGGKNIIPYPYYTADGTYGGIPFSTASDGKIMASGTTNAADNFYLIRFGTLKAGTYTLSIKGNHSGLKLRFYDRTNEQTLVDIQPSTSDSYATITTTSDLTVHLFFNIPTSDIAVNISAYIQLEEGSTATSYVPYSNICPISGRSSVEIKGCGKNLLNYDDISLIQSTSQEQDRRYGFVIDKPGTYTISGITGLQPNGYLFVKKVSASGIYGAVAYVCVPSAATVENPCTRTIADGEKLLCYTYISDNKQTAITIFNNMKAQLELGSSATEYEPYAESNDVTITFPAVGKNLFDKDACVFVSGKYIKDDGSIGDNDGYRYCETYISVKSSTNYVFSGVMSSTATVYNSVAFYDSNKEFISRFLPQTPGTGAVFTTPVNCAYIRFNTQNNYLYVDMIQLEEGSTATTYEPYTNTVYSGTLDVEKGVLTVDKGYVDLGSLTWQFRGNGIFSAPISENYYLYSQNVKAICDNYKYNGTVQSWSAAGSAIGCYLYYNPIVSTTHMIYICDTNFSDATTFKTAMSGVKFVYELAETKTIQLTPEQIQILKGQNTIWIEDEGATIALTYKN